jgi:hypothetical protein
MRLRALIMIKFFDNDWSHQINSIKMIHRQIKMCESFEHVLYRKIDYMTSFDYNFFTNNHYFCDHFIINTRFSQSQYYE